MDESMANISDDFIISLPGPSNPRNAFHTPINPVGLGFHPRIAPSDLPEPDESFYSGEGEWTEGASPVRVEDEGSQGEVNEAAEEEDDVEGSETSSVIFNHEADPEGWAKRLDELAGVLETSEVEARAIRWGPAIGHDKDAPDLPLEKFRALINHHLTTTEWRYTSAVKLFPPVPSRAMERGPGFGRDMLGGMGEMHPIRVIGHNWFDRDPTNLEWRMDSMSREGFDVAAGLGIDMGGEGTGR